MKTLTAVIITKNCQDDIGKCLESVKWANEVVIVDGFSTDSTLDVCRRYTDKIIQHKFEDDFAKERNIGIDNATGDWLLQLDADEIVTDELRKDIEKILSSEEEPFAAYKFRRKNFFLGHFMRYGGWYHYSLHFFKKGKARYKGEVDETLIVDGKIGKIESAIEHYPFKNISELILRQNRYSGLEAKKMLREKGILDKKTIYYNIKIKPLKRFWKFYVKKKGFLEGKYGFIFSVLFAWVHFLRWAKYWELLKNKGKI